MSSGAASKGAQFDQGAVTWISVHDDLVARLQVLVHSSPASDAVAERRRLLGVLDQHYLELVRCGGVADEHRSASLRTLREAHVELARGGSAADVRAHLDAHAEVCPVPRRRVFEDPSTSGPDGRHTARLAG